MTAIGWLVFALLLSAKALLVLAAAYGLTRLMGGRSAAERHLVWMLASACVLALPALSLAGPAWRISVPASWVGAVDRSVPPDEAVVAVEPVVAAARAVSVKPAVGAAQWTPESRRERLTRALGAPALMPVMPVTPGGAASGPGSSQGSAASQEAVDAAVLADEVPAPMSARAAAGTVTGTQAPVAPARGTPTPIVPARSGVPVILLLIWVMGSLVVLTRIAVGLVRVHRLARSARPLLDPALLVRSHGIAAEMGIERPISLLEGDGAAMPVTFGILRPTLLLPSTARGWSRARQNAVLRHELEHVRRRDTLSQMIAELGCALYWFNPLMWWASRRMCIEREHACDDAVLAAGSRPSEYAAELLDIARTLKAPRTTDIAAIAMARTSHLKTRVTSLLDAERRRERTSTRLLVPSWIGAFMLTMPLGTLAFEMGGRLGHPADDAPATVAVHGQTGQTVASQRPWSKEQPALAASAMSGTFAADTPPAPLPAPAPLAWPTPPGVPPAPAPLAWPTPPRAPAAPAPLAWPTPPPVPAAPAPLAWPTPPGAPAAPAPLSRPTPPGALPAPAPLAWPTPPPAPAPPYPPALPSFAARVGSALAGLSGAPTTQQDCLSGGRNTRVNSSSNNRRRTTTWEGSDCSGDVLVEGDIEFDAAFTTITGISNGGRMRVTTEEGGTERSVTITPANGGLAYDYRVNGDRREFDAEGREWLSSTMLFMFRRFGFMAEERAASIVQRGGTNALLAEVDVLTSDFVRSSYLSVLIERGQLDEATLNRVLTIAGNTIDSDHYRTRIITAVAGRYPFTDGVRSAYIDAVTAMDSDHYRHNAFSTLLEKGRLTPAQVSAVLGEARRIESDHYRARLLDELSASYSSTPAIREAYLAAATSIDSDHYKAGVLSDLLAMDGLTSAELAQVVNAAGSIDSDHYRARVLMQSAESGLGDAALQSAFLRSAAGIDSDHHLHSVLATVARRDNLDNTTLLALLDAADGIESDHYLSQLLVQVIERHRPEGEVRARVESLMRGIESRTWRGRVAEALVGRGS